MAEPKTWVIDLDGVVWRGKTAIEGGAEACQRLVCSGETLIFATNNSALRIEELTFRLRKAGIEIPADHIVTSGQVAGHYVARLDVSHMPVRVFVIGEAGLIEALEEIDGIAIVDGESGADAVVVGWCSSFDFAMLARAMGLIRAGAKLVGANEDPTLPASGPTNLLPGSGALLAAVAVASQVVPKVVGKPHPEMAAAIRARVQEIGAPSIGIVVGDCVSTDGALARALGVRFGLVLSGATSPNELDDQSRRESFKSTSPKGQPSASVVPELVADDLLGVVAKEGH